MRRGYADTRLGQVHYTTWGESSKPPIVLLAQSANSAAMFKELAAGLDSDFYVVALDTPGSGWSDPLPDGTTFGQVAAAFIDAVDTLGLGKCAYYGHHTGNKIGAAIAAAFPDRVSQLIFVGQSHSIVAGNEQRAGTVGKTRRKLLEATDEKEAALVLWTDQFNRFNARWWSEAMVRDLGNPARRAAIIRKVADELLAAQSMPALYTANFANDLEGDLRRVQAPTLVIEIVTALEDRTVGRQGDILKTIIPNATVAIIEEPDGPANTMEHRATDLARLVRTFLEKQ